MARCKTAMTPSEVVDEKASLVLSQFGFKFFEMFTHLGWLNKRQHEA